MKPALTILDTDMSTDVDDAGALAVLHALADRGEAKILAVMHNTGHPLGVPVIDVINTYYGRNDIPVGAFKGNFDNENARPYLEDLVKKFPYEQVRSSAPAAVTLYRRLLSEAADNSITIASIGFLTNLRDLLLSGSDEWSPLSGCELIARHVKNLVVMGGSYPSSQSPEWNFTHAGAAEYTKDILSDWPSPMTFIGSELGSAILTGATLENSPESNPVKAAYKSFFLGRHQARESWDLITVLYAVRGSCGLFTESANGSNQLLPDGNNHWSEVPGPHPRRFLTATQPNSEIEKTLDALLTAPPAMASRSPEAGN